MLYTPWLRKRLHRVFSPLRISWSAAKKRQTVSMEGWVVVPDPNHGASDLLKTGVPHPSSIATGISRFSSISEVFRAILPPNLVDTAIDFLSPCTANPNPSFTGHPNFAFAWKLLAFLSVLECIRSISVQLSVRNSLFVTCSSGLQTATTLLFPDLYFGLIRTTFTMRPDHTWWMQRSHSCAPSKVIVSRLSQTVCKRKWSSLVNGTLVRLT